MTTSRLHLAGPTRCGCRISISLLPAQHMEGGFGQMPRDGSHLESIKKVPNSLWPGRPKGMLSRRILISLPLSHFVVADTGLGIMRTRNCVMFQASAKPHEQEAKVNSYTLHIPWLEAACGLAPSASAWRCLRTRTSFGASATAGQIQTGELAYEWLRSRNLRASNSCAPSARCLVEVTNESGFGRRTTS